MKKIKLILLSLAIAVPLSVDAAKLEIVKFNYNAEGNDNYNLNDEYVVLKNISDKKLNLRKWRILDNDSHKLIFPKIILKKNQKIKIYSGQGVNKLNKKIIKVYWGNRWGLWNNDSDILKIKNKKKKLVLKYKY